MLAVPDDSTHRTKVADWMELMAISSPDGRVGFSTLISATALAENEQEADVADEDMEDDQLVLRVQDEITRRRESIGDDYPFRIDPNGRAMGFVTPVTTAGSIYLFCLFLSHAFDVTIVPRALSPKVTDATRKLFQACSTVAAGGYVGGPSVSFGWPRPDGSKFLQALKVVYKKFGDGVPVRKPRAAAAKAIKDNGIDIIAWRRTADKLPGTHYLVGQVASGKNWSEKSVVTDRDHFHKYWFQVQPASSAQDAMFMPFGLEPEEVVDGTPYAEVLNDYVQSVTYRFGVLFYRDRITVHLAASLRLIAGGESAIEGHGELPKIVRWVENYTKRLRAA